MKINCIIGSVLMAGLLMAGLAGCATGKEKQARLESKAKVSKAEAERIALAKVPNGAIREAELEKEKGRLIWSFDIATPGTRDITEVNIDALSGEVVGLDKESPKDEAKEAAGKKGEKEKDEKGEKN